MDTAEARDQVGRGDADYLASRQKAGQGRGGDRVGWSVEGRHQDCAIRYIEVRVGGGQTGAVVDDVRGHRERLDFEQAAVLIAHRAQPIEIVAQDGVVYVGGDVLAA